MRSIVSETERCFELLKGEFFFLKRSAVSQPRIGSGRGDAGRKMQEDDGAFSRAEEKRARRYGTGYELATLGALALLRKEADSTVGELIEADHFLEKQKGYGVFGLGRKQRLMHAGMLLTSDYLGNGQQPGDEFRRSQRCGFLSWQHSRLRSVQRSLLPAPLPRRRLRVGSLCRI